MATYFLYQLSVNKEIVEVSRRLVWFHKRINRKTKKYFHKTTNFSSVEDGKQKI